MPKTLDKAEKRDRIRYKKKYGMKVDGKAVFIIVNILTNRRRELMPKIDKAIKRDEKIDKRNLNKVSDYREDKDRNKKPKRSWKEQRNKKEDFSYLIIKKESII